MSTTVCFTCGNEARASELAWIDTPLGDRLEHVGDCPMDSPAGYQDCRGCGGAYASLATVEWVQPLRFDETGAWVESRGGRFVALGSEPPARHVRVTRADYETGLLDVLPAGTAGVVLDGWPIEPGYWVDSVLCSACLGRLGVKADIKGQGSKESETAPLDKVPADPEHGLLLADLIGAWGVKERKAREMVAAYVADGSLASTDERTSRGSIRKRYHQVPR
ncbi:MAG: hypothetical protein AB1627_02515 [Chloroflexota bacterium]